MREIEIGKTYKHFKGHLYKVIDIVYDCESNNNEELDKVVIYQNLENGMKWARKYDDFNSYVDTVKYPEVTQKYRFEEVTNTKE
ncbi:MAG: DUF1653 domain-containing protein [Bacilli bacterium]|nr:DUF1653 domain-containing protein [Bacilli bacterium]